MSGLRTFTDNFIFGNDPKERNVLQAATRDISHGIFHFGGAIFNGMTGNFEQAAKDLKRAGDHFGGENLDQRNETNYRRRNSSSSSSS